MRIMVRHARDDFDAMHVANGMEAAGAEVFSITVDGSDTFPNAMAPHATYTVWAKIESEEMCDAVDEAIDKERGS
jgi:2'-5' RNA ligase